MRIVLTFILNAGLNFALGLAVAAMLGPSDYGRFAVGTVLAGVLATGLFDWLRLSTTRFYGETQRHSEPALRGTLNTAYAGIAAMLVACAAILVLVRVDLGIGAALAAAAVLGAIANGFFDFQTALARARFLDRSYAILVAGKAVLGLSLALIAAKVLHDPAAVLAAIAVGTMLAIVPVRRQLSDRTVAPGRIEHRRLRSFAAYGAPVVAANVVFQLVTLMNRSAAASSFGFADAGQLSLSTDICLRLLLAVGAAVDVFIFQLAVRSEAEHGPGAARRQLRLNMVIVSAILVFLGVSFAMAMPAFTSLVVPPRYQADFGPLSLALLPGILLFCLGQFAINPVFQMAGRTMPIISGALVTLLVDGVGLLLLPHAAGVHGLALLHAGSLAVGFCAVAALALRDKAVRPPLRDLAGIGIAGLVTALALWPIRSLETPWLALGVAGVVSPCVYGAVLILLDVAGLRPLVLGRIGRWTRVPTSQQAV